MSEFLAEVYVPRGSAGSRLPRPEHVWRAADMLSRDGTAVRFLRAILVPEDETCLFLFGAPSKDAVREVAALSGLRVERIAEVEADWTAPLVHSADAEALPVSASTRG